MDNTTKTALIDITKSYLSQQETISALTASTIETCMDLYTNLKNDLETKSKHVVNEIKSKVHSAEQDSIRKNNAEWLAINAKMKNSHS